MEQRGEKRLMERKEELSLIIEQMKTWCKSKTPEQKQRRRSKPGQVTEEN